MRNRWKECGGRGCSRRMGQFLDPALLLLLEQAPSHGYTLLNRMAEFGLDFLTPTVVYRALREMAKEGWVTSTWDTESTQGPPRRVYELTPVGHQILECCITQLQHTQQVLEYFFALHNELSPEDSTQAITADSVSEESAPLIVIPAKGTDLDAPTSPIFGRCPTFILVDPDTLNFEALSNPALDASSGAGAQAAQTVLQYDVRAIIAPKLGPNAFRVIQAADVPAYVLKGATVREAVEAFKARELTQIEEPGADHAGLGRGRRHRHGRGSSS